MREGVLVECEVHIRAEKKCLYYKGTVDGGSEREVMLVKCEIHIINKREGREKIYFLNLSYFL